MHLPLLEGHRAAVESCTFCPKLCRAACPVSEADGRETTTPWGKMSDAFLVSRGGVEATASHAATAWACSGCRACRQSCDLHNSPALALFDARADYLAAGLAPPAVQAFVAQRPVRVAARAVATTAAIRSARARGAVIDEAAPVAVLTGCGSDVAAVDAIVATAALVAGPVAVLSGCCGADARASGDLSGFEADARALAAALARVRRLVVADAECAETVRLGYPARGLALAGVEVLHLSELAAAELPRLSRVALEGPVRYHDACSLGRGLGVYDPPRQVLTRALGRAPDELPRRREGAQCSGGGGLLPVSMPEVAREIAETRAKEHARAGGGVLITTCGRAVQNLRASGVDARDLGSVIVAALAGR